MVDNSFKGTIQELLTAAYPNTAFAGRYSLRATHPADPHPETKVGYAFHQPARPRWRGAPRAGAANLDGTDPGNRRRRVGDRAHPARPRHRPPRDRARWSAAAAPAHHHRSATRPQPSADPRLLSGHRGAGGEQGRRTPRGARHRSPSGGTLGILRRRHHRTGTRRHPGRVHRAAARLDRTRPDHSANMALSTFTFCSIPDPAAAARAAYRVLVPGGRFVLAEHGPSRHA
ncbi:methyltransferase domain-containing protein, partial [Pseudonocardia sp. KRD291]|uniref:methyltransferase domain-containing protein n=1 Tax=Pseudonocardia sp. KRD291 TaxID=2792007 RepID=UPI0027E25B3F